MAKKQTKKATNKKSEAKVETKKKGYTPPSEIRLSLMPYFLVLIAFFMLLCIFATSFTGVVGKWLKDIFAGLFSWGIYFIPALLVGRAFCYRKEATSRFPMKGWIFSFIFVVAVAGIVATAHRVTEGYNVIEHFNSAIDKEGHITTGSLFGGLISNVLSPLIGRIPTFIILGLTALITAPLTVSKTPLDLARFIVGLMKMGREKQEEIRKARDEYFDKKEKEEIEKAKKAEKVEKHPHIEEEAQEIEEEEPYTIEEGGDITDTRIIDLKEKDSDLKTIFATSTDPEVLEAFTPEDDNIEEMAEETDISSNDDTLETEVNEVALGEAEEEEEGVPEYVFPPVHLLTKGTPPTESMNAEYEQTAKKLVDALASFGVKTKLLNIAKGPTVTRYELQPETGVRVRSIRNLADDISLSLASKGVRIEAPIPGKEAVGIEVPNKTTSVVNIRTLIESNQFENSKSKLTTCLGKDVAGNPVYCDIAKMPHMLIAGTTGSGKSVCINSILMSILYKARPEEVKLILIDPKKIELGVYNGIGHLLVPVVSDPKNAAGALAWSVNEMERRFALIEEVGVREIKAYNEVALREGDREILPQIVIIIDELADLMMMARDSVESSICRIAQKARAAGMHLILGTQRPSVDVITGLIKANVPSRIAFTVASQTDSRTIIDLAGAEKLVGKGDMLYSPVGAMTPTRVQGSFVSDSEIEAVISFLKNNTSANYSEEIMDSIEKEAAKCEKSRSKSSDDDDMGVGGDLTLNSDEMLRPAIEIALDSGTISTSMLQRKLKLGYARAARLIDMMQELGVVSEFAGSKPRTVLISREKYMEMVTNADN